MQCPQCSSALASLTYEGVPIHTCNACGGEFIGGQELAHIVHTRQEQFDPELKELLAERTPRFGVPEEARRTLCCPACGEPMVVVSYGGDSGIFVDRCDSCDGLWLDHEELERIQVLQERWADEAPQQLRDIAGQLEMARQRAAQSTNAAFAGSRFAFVNALINRFLDAA
ncbi:MAG: zf-TFIIB domain-containing protein [Planctomycetota bacterium]|jgi:Zn-finger nucleic acid-binding protein